MATSIVVPIGSRIAPESVPGGLPCAESSVTSLSWIPQGAVEGFNRLSFGIRAPIDPPPPGGARRPGRTGRRRPVPVRQPAGGLIEVQDGRIVDAGQGGGGRINVTKVGYGTASIAFSPITLPELRPDPEIGPTWARFVQTARSDRLPHPRRVRHEPYVQIGGPVTWSTLALTIHADGTVEPRLVGASSFPRHWVSTTPVGWSPRAATLTTTRSGTHTPGG